LADPESTTKQSLDITVPASEVDAETARVVDSLQKKIRLPGFRPGKVPAGIIRSRYQSDIRHEVLEKLIPRHFFKRAEQEGLAVVGTPNITDVKLEPGEPLSFKAEFEVAPTIELKDYKDVTIPYQDPEITDEDVDQRIAQLREQKAEYINVDPRAVESGDYAVLSLESVAGVTGAPIKQDELTLHVGGEDTLSDFSDNLLGMLPGDEKEFDVRYPEDYGQAKLAGKTLRFHATLKGIRRKELPELNDEFARDLGDFQNLEELRETVRKSLFTERQFLAQQEAKGKIVDVLVERHEFPVPEAFIERQIESEVEHRLQMLAAEGVDPRSVKLDWEKLKESHRDRAIHDVKASLLVNRIADTEQIYATQDEVDHEVQRIARQDREPAAAVRKRLEQEDGLRRIANRIRTEKTLNFLFEHARKEAPEG
jgi:trigger factor